MTKRFCDLCGKEVEELKQKELLISFDKNNDWFVKNCYEICKSCERELETALYQKEVEFVQNSKMMLKNSQEE